MSNEAEVSEKEIIQYDRQARLNLILEKNIPEKNKRQSWRKILKSFQLKLN